MPWLPRRNRPLSLETAVPLTVTEIRDHVGVITLDHPARRNALSEALIDEIVAALADFKARRLRVAILRAQPGATVWSAGHDVDAEHFDEPHRLLNGCRHGGRRVDACRCAHSDVWCGDTYRDGIHGVRCQFQRRVPMGRRSHCR
jgi:hypothetical protein